MRGISHEAITKQVVYPLWQERSMEVVDQYLAEDADVRTSFICGTGPQILRESVRVTFTAFPNLNVILDDVLQQDNFVMYKWQANAIHEGEIMGIKPALLPIQFAGVVYGKIEQGKITQYHSISNIFSELRKALEIRAHFDFIRTGREAITALQLLTDPALSVRELECLSLWLKGYSIRQSAFELGGLSERTIQTHRERIKNKFKLENFQQIFCFIQNTGLLPVLFGIRPSASRKLLGRQEKCLTVA